MGSEAGFAEGDDTMTRVMCRAGFVAAAMVFTGCTAGPTPLETQLQGIVGGEETTEWPEVVALVLGEGTILCTGTLIAPDVVLTAAHCGILGVPGDVAYFGSSIFEAGGVVEILAIENHPDYDEENPRHDLAIAFLAEESEVEPAVIDTRSVNSSWTGTTMHAVGFGNADSYMGETGGIKRETDVDISGVDTYILYHETPGQNTCSGDSGGPLFVKEEQEGDDDAEEGAAGWVQVAVAAFVYPLDTYEDYCSGGGGDVRLDKHLEWIEEVVELGLVLEEDEGDDDTGQVSYLEDDDSAGCAASVAPGRRPVGWLIAALLTLGWARRSFSRAR